MPTHQNDSYYQTNRVKQRTVYANYSIARQAFLQGQTIHLPSPLNADVSVMAALAAGPLQFTPAEIAAVLASSSAYSVPGPVRDLAGTPGSAQVVLTWTAPLSDGGSPITSYMVSWPSGSRTTSGLTVTVTGLADGSYTFTVVAMNSEGSGAPASVDVTVGSQGGMWVAGGYNDSGANLLYSTDNGMNWNDASGASLPFSGGNCSTIAYNGTTWVAGGTNDSGAKLLYSTDNGMNWNDASGVTAAFLDGGCYTIAYNGTTWVAGGYSQSGAKLLYSTDNGMNWNDASGASLPFLYGNCNIVVFNGSA